MSRIITQTDIVIEIIKSPEELVELAQSLLKLAYGNEATGISLNLGLGFYGAIEQSFQIRFINEDLLEITEDDEDDEQEYDDDEEPTEQELETEENEIDEEAFASSLRELFSGMGLIVANLGEGIVSVNLDDSEQDADTGVVIPGSESELVSTEQPASAPVDTTDYSDVSHLYSGQI